MPSSSGPPVTPTRPPQWLRSGGWKASTCALLALTTCLPAAVAAQNNWQPAYPISELTPKRKIGGLVRFNDPSFFYAEEGRLVTHHGRYKRHRTFLFPNRKMASYPYKLRVRMRKRDNFRE